MNITVDLYQLKMSEPNTLYCIIKYRDYRKENYAECISIYKSYENAKNAIKDIVVDYINKDDYDYDDINKMLFNECFQHLWKYNNNDTDINDDTDTDEIESQNVAKLTDNFLVMNLEERINFIKNNTTSIDDYLKIVCEYCDENYYRYGGEDSIIFKIDKCSILD